MLLQAMGRHRNRPAHVHFFVIAHSYRKLTTQINIDGDEYLHDDFAFPRVKRVTDAAEIHKVGLNLPLARIRFDFTVTRKAAGAPTAIVAREHAEAA